MFASEQLSWIQYRLANGSGDRAIVAPMVGELFEFVVWWFDDSTMFKPPPSQVLGPAVNRFADVMAHHDRFAFKGVSRLAREAGVSPSSVSRLVNGKGNPSFLMVVRLTEALERTFGYSIDPRDLVAENGEFIHRFCCDLVGCPGCLPENALDEFGDVKSMYKDVKPGQWVSSRHPKGVQHPKGGV